MKPTISVIAFAALFACSAALAADVQERASFCGTVVSGVEAKCLLVKGSMVGAPLYNISSAHPRPRLGSMITGSGIAGGVSTCMQGVVLTDITWHHAAACPLDSKAH